MIIFLKLKEGFQSSEFITTKIILVSEFITQLAIIFPMKRTFGSSFLKEKKCHYKNGF